MPNANRIRMKLANAGSGPAGKKEAAKFFHDGAFELPLRSGSIVRVVEADPHFEAKSLWALSAMRASFQDAPALLDENDARVALGLPDDAALPPGFYAIAPGAPAQIASAYLPRLAGEDSREEWESARSHPAIAAAISERAMTCHAEFDVNAFVAARDPLADYMSLGQGLAEEERATLRAARRGSSLNEFGLSLWTSLPSGREAFGFPAIVSLSGAADGLARPRPSAAKGLLTADGSIAASAAQMQALPIHNHDGCSEINNARDIRDAIDRAPERGDIVDSMADLMLAQAAILNGSRDAALGFDAFSDAEREEQREDAGENELKKLGKERKLFIKQGKSAVHRAGEGPEGSCLVVSMDMALVDGQHSSRDFALIAQGCAAKPGSSGPDYWGHPIVDCAPAMLAERAFERAMKRWNDLDGRSELERDPLELGLAKLHQALGRSSNSAAKAREEEAARAACFARFSTFAPAIPVQVAISAISDPHMARMFVRIENTSAPQGIESNAVATHFSGVHALTADFNAGAAAAGDPTRLTAIKSLHANPDFSLVDQPQLATSEFIELYPFLKSVGDSARTMAGQTKHLARQDEVANAAKWESLAILASEGHRVDKREDPHFQCLHERVAVLLLAIGALKQRDFELNSSRLPGTLDAVRRPGTIGKTLIEFSKIAIARAKRVFGADPKSLAKNTSPLETNLSAPETDAQRQRRVYALGKAAMELKDALRPARRTSAGMFKTMMSDSTLDNVMLTMLAARYSLDHERHPAGASAARDLRCAQERLQWHADHSSDTTFNKAREHLKAEVARMADAPIEWPAFPSRGPISESTIEKAVRHSLFMGMASPTERRMIIDAAPGPGLALAAISALPESKIDLAKLRALRGARERDQGPRTASESLPG